eukprot:scaffold405583_cov22-Prasinocladus_malaysianus.AAC.1
MGPRPVHTMSICCNSTMESFGFNLGNYVLSREVTHIIRGMAMCFIAIRNHNASCDTLVNGRHIMIRSLPGLTRLGI